MFSRFTYPQFKHSRSPRPLFRHAYRLVRRPSKVTLGAAAVTVGAAIAVAAGVSAGSSSTPGAPNGAPNDIAQAQRAAAGRLPDHGRTGSARSQAPSHAPAKDYLIYDSVLPSALPANHTVATYATGGFAVSPSQLAGHKSVLWIDTRGYDYNASVLDIEPGDATPSIAKSWTWHRLHAHPHAIARLYTMISEWPAVQAAVAQLPASMRSQVRYWIADPTGTPHVVPGSDATQWYWGTRYDISTATPRF